MNIDRGYVEKPPKLVVVLIVFFVALTICAGDGGPFAVSTEVELHAALWNASVVDIILLGDVHVRSKQLWSQQPTSISTPRPPAPAGASTLAPSTRPVPIGRQLQIRGYVSSNALAESHLSSDQARNLRLPLLDLSEVRGWLRLLPNAKLNLKGLHISTNLSTEQPDLRPYRALLRALLAPPLPVVDQQQEKQLLLTAVSLENCLEIVNVGLTQDLAGKYIRDLPTLPNVVAASPMAAWAALPAPLIQVQLQTLRKQPCIVSSSSSSSNNNTGRTQGLSGITQHRRAQEAGLGWRLHGGVPQPQYRSVRAGNSRCLLDGIPAAGFLKDALCWLAGLASNTMALPLVWIANVAHVRLQELCPRFSDREGRSNSSSVAWDASWVGPGRVGRMVLSESGTDTSASSLGSEIACLGWSILVNRAATALAFQLVDYRVGLAAVTDDLLASTVYGSANNRTAGTSNGGDDGAEVTTSPVLLLLLVVDSYSASIAQVDEACLDSADADIVACLEQAATVPAPPTPTPLMPLTPPPVLLRLAPAERDSGFKVALWVVLAMTGLLLLALLLVLYKFRRLQRRHIQEQGAQRAPGVGPLTTLLITDIANSTGLWESLPEEVMDQALKLHHACLRALLQRFNGYESATEGDSFILAFHYPADAAKFALSAQVQLMDVMWPAEVLAHPDGQEVWVVPRSAEITSGEALQPLTNNLSSTLNVEDGGAVGASISVQRSSGGILGISNAAPAGGIGTLLRHSDVGYSGGGGNVISSGGGGGSGASGGFLRASWTGRVKFTKAMGPTGLHSPLRPSGLLPPGLLPPGVPVGRSTEIDHMSASELGADEMGYTGGSRSGSGLLRSLSTVLGLLPMGPGGGAAGSSGRPSSRIGRFLRLSAMVSKSAGGCKSSSSQGLNERSVTPRLPVSSRRRQAGTAGTEVTGATFRSKSFGGRLLVGGGPSSTPARPSGSAGPGSGRSHGVAAIAMGTAPSTSTHQGSFTSGAHSLLRMALSFNRRHGSFQAPSRAAAEVTTAAAVSAMAITASVTAAANTDAGGAAVHINPALAAITMTASTAGLPGSLGSPVGSRYGGSYHSPQLDNDPPAPAEAAIRHVTGEGLQVSSCESVTQANSSRGLFRNGLLRLARGMAVSGNGSAAMRVTSSSASSALAAVSGTTTSGPTAVALAMSPEGRRRRFAVASCGGSGMSPQAAGLRGGVGGATGRLAVSSMSGACQRRRRSHTHGLYGEVVAGVAYGNGAATHPRLPASCDGSLVRGGINVGTTIAGAAVEAAAVAAVTRATNDDGVGVGCSTSQGGALGTAYESEITTGPLFASFLGAGSSNASGCIGTDDARQLSNGSAALVMDVLAVADTPRGSAVAPRVPQFRSALLFEGVRGDGGHLPLAVFQGGNMRRSSAPANVGASILGLLAGPAADQAGLPPEASRPLPTSSEAVAADGGRAHGSNITAAVSGVGGNAPASSSGIGHFGVVIDSIGGSAIPSKVSSPSLACEQSSLGRLPRRPFMVPSAHRLEQSSLLVNHNQLYGADADSETHVGLGSCELPVSDSIKLLSHHHAVATADNDDNDDDLVPQDCNAALRGISPDAATNVQDVEETGMVAVAEAPGETETVAAAATTVAEASSPLSASLEVAGMGSGRDGHKTTSATAGASEFISITSSSSGGPRSFQMLPSRATGPPGVSSPTNGGASSLSATLARLMRNRARDVRLHSSPTARSAVRAGGRAPRSGAVSTAPIQESGDAGKRLQHDYSSQRQLRASSCGDAAPDCSLLLRPDEHATTGMDSSSAGQLQPIVGSTMVGSSSRGIGTYCRSSGGGVTIPPITGQSPSASRTASMTFGPLSQTVARGWSRANILVRQLTRDRSASRAGRCSTAPDSSIATTFSGPVATAARGGGDGGGNRAAPYSGVTSGATSGLLWARLATSDAEADSGAELSAVGILADGLRSRAAAGSVSVSEAVPKLHVGPMPFGGGSGSGDEGPTIDLGAALTATTDEDDVSMLAPPGGSAKFPDLSPPPPSSRNPRYLAKSASRTQLLATADGGSGCSSHGLAGAGTGGTSGAPPQTLVSTYLGVASRRISFLGLGLVPRSRTVERRSSATEEWQTGPADVTGPLFGAFLSQTGPQSQLTPAVVADCRSWREKCREDWPPAMRPAPPARCAYRGLRVRMGLHTGITTASDVTFNPTTSHMAYSGTAMKVAKAVGDAAAGGMILMSQSTFQSLVSVMMDLPGSPQAVFSGESDLCLGSDAAHYCLYQLVHRDLVQRIGYSAQLRNISFTQLGTEDAPTGFCAISFMHVASASMLVAELGQPGVEALQQFKSIATGLCSRCGGYVVEASEGLCLAAFRHAAAALVWALASREALASHPWSAEVRRWYRFAVANAPHATNRGARGPRPRTGVHVGSVNVDVNAATGRMTYRGKVMNRTSRISHKATSEQIVCSKDAWDAVEMSLQRMVAEIQDEQRREQEALKEAAAARAAVTSSTMEEYGEGQGDDAYGDDDMVSELGGGGGPASAVNSTRALSPTGTPSSRLMTSGIAAAILNSNHGSIASTRGGGSKQAAAGRGGSGGSKAGSAPSSVRSALAILASHQQLEGAVSDGLNRIKPSSLAASLAASVRGHRSASAKHLSAAAAAAAAALSRRVTSFTTRPSSNSLPELLPAAAAVGLASGSLAGRAPSITAGAPPSNRVTGPPPSNRVLAALAAAPSGASSPTSPRRSIPHVAAPSPVVLGFNPAMHVSTASANGNASEAVGVIGGAAVDTGGGTGSAVPGVIGAPPSPPPPSLHWQALSRLVGPKVQLPAAKRLEARLLGSYSLKGVREEMKLYEVFWADEEETTPICITVGGSGHEGSGGRSGGGGSIGADGPRRDNNTTCCHGSAATNATSPDGVVAEAAAMTAGTSAASPPSLGARERKPTAAAEGASPEGLTSSQVACNAVSASPLTTTTASSPVSAGGGSGGGVESVLSTVAAAAALPISAKPVVLSSAEIRQFRTSGKFEWPATDTGCSVYDDDMTGGVLQPADATDPAAAVPTESSGPAPTLQGIVTMAGNLNAMTSSSSAAGGGSHLSMSGRNSAHFPEISIPGLGMECKPGSGNAEGGGWGVSGGRGGGGVDARSLQGLTGSAGAYGSGWLQQQPPPTPAQPPQQVPENHRVTIWPIPSLAEPTSTHGAHSSKILSPQSQQQHHGHSTLLRPQLHPQLSLRPELPNNNSGSGHHTTFICSPSLGTSRSFGGVGDTSTGSNTSSRRRHLSGSLGVTFADQPLGEPNQGRSPREVYQRAASAAPRASRSHSEYPLPSEGCTAGGGTDRPPVPAAGTLAATGTLATVALTRPLSVRTPVRVLAQPPTIIRPVLEPRPLRTQTSSAWVIPEAAVPGVDVTSPQISGVAVVASPSPSASVSPSLPPADAFPSELGSSTGGEQRLHRFDQSLQQGQPLSPPYIQGTPWALHAAEFAREWKGRVSGFHKDLPTRRSWEGFNPAVAAAAAAASSSRDGHPVVVRADTLAMEVLPPPPPSTAAIKIEVAVENASWPQTGTTAH